MLTYTENPVLLHLQMVALVYALELLWAVTGMAPQLRSKAKQLLFDVGIMFAVATAFNGVDCTYDPAETAWPQRMDGGNCTHVEWAPAALLDKTIDSDSEVVCFTGAHLHSVALSMFVLLRLFLTGIPFWAVEKNNSNPTILMDGAFNLSTIMGRLMLTMARTLGTQTPAAALTILCVFSTAMAAITQSNPGPCQGGRLPSVPFLNLDKVSMMYIKRWVHALYTVKFTLESWCALCALLSVAVNDRETQWPCYLFLAGVAVLHIMFFWWNWTRPRDEDEYQASRELKTLLQGREGDPSAHAAQLEVLHMLLLPEGRTLLAPTNNSFGLTAEDVGQALDVLSELFCGIGSTSHIRTLSFRVIAAQASTPPHAPGFLTRVRHGWKSFSGLDHPKLETAIIQVCAKLAAWLTEHCEEDLSAQLREAILDSVRVVITQHKSTTTNEGGARAWWMHFGISGIVFNLVDGLAKLERLSNGSQLPVVEFFLKADSAHALRQSLEPVMWWSEESTCLRVTPEPIQWKAGRVVDMLKTAVVTKYEMSKVEVERVDFGAQAVGPLKELANLVNELPTLDVLMLRACQINSEGGKALATMLRGNASLTCLNLAGNQMEDPTFEMLAHGLLLQSKALTDLDVQGNLISSKGATAMADALKNNPTIRTINVSGSSLPLAELGAAQAIDLSDAQVDDITCIILAAVLHGNIHSLILKGNRVGDEGMEALAGALKLGVCMQLSIFDISNNSVGDKGMTALAEALGPHVFSSGACPELSTLDFSGNNVEDEGMEVLADALKSGAGKKINMLNFSGNKVGDNGIAALMSALKSGACQQLRILDFSDNWVASQGMKVLADAFKPSALDPFNQPASCPQLNTLSFSGNNVRGKGMEELAGALKSGAFPKLSEFNFSCNSIGDDGMSELVDALKSGACPELNSLNLSGNDVGGIGMKELAGTLQSGACPQLSTLDCHDNWVEDEGMKVLAAALASGACPMLGVLKFSHNGVGPKGTKPLADALKLKVCPHLIILDFSDNGVGDEGIEVLAGALQSKACPQLSTLNLSKNRIGDKGMKMLASALKSKACPQLGVLDFSDNLVGDDGMEVLADAFKSGACPQLDALNFSCNGVKHEGVEVLAGALGSGACPQLCVLNLSRNKAGDRGMEVLAGALKSKACPLLKTLNVSDNGVKDEGMEVLAGALGSGACPQLSTLDFSKNKVGDKGMEELASALQSGACLQLNALNFSDNGVKDEGMEVLAGALGSGACPQLSTLDFSKNKVGGKGMEELASALHSGACLQLNALNFSGNNIGGENMKVLVDAVGCGACPKLHLAELD